MSWGHFYDVMYYSIKVYVVLKQQRFRNVAVLGRPQRFSNTTSFMSKLDNNKTYFAHNFFVKYQRKIKFFNLRKKSSEGNRDNKDLINKIAM